MGTYPCGLPCIMVYVLTVFIWNGDLPMWSALYYGLCFDCIYLKWGLTHVVCLVLWSMFWLYLFEMGTYPCGLPCIMVYVLTVFIWNGDLPMWSALYYGLCFDYLFEMGTYPCGLPCIVVYVEEASVGRLRLCPSRRQRFLLLTTSGQTCGIKRLRSLKQHRTKPHMNGCEYYREFPHQRGVLHSTGVYLCFVSCLAV